MKKLTLAVIMVLLAYSVVSHAADKVVEQSTPGAGLTVYMDISVMGRKARAAKRMTELHREHFAKGWEVIDVEPYVENGDLQGFFITYVGRE